MPVIGTSNSRPTTPIASPTSPVPSKRSSRFRLPLSPSARTAGLPPADYAPVDFEERLSRLSFEDDDDHDATPSKNRRRSKDDAWVDILVSSSSRRMGMQEAEFRNAGALKGGRSDPELASQEVSEVLAAVRGQLPLDDEDDEGMEPIHDTSNYSYRAPSYLDDKSAEGAPSETDRSTLPGQSTEEDEEDEVVISPAMHLPTKRGLGYFDLHPERRPQLDVEQIARGSPSPAPQEHHQPTPERRSYDDPRARFERPSLDASEESNYDDAPDAVSPIMEPATPVAPVPPPKHDYNDISRSYSPSGHRMGRPLPQVAVSPPVEERPTPPRPGGSKTASLIEMYRERERSAMSSSLPQSSSSSASAAPAAVSSKLPVRTGASLNPNNAAVRERSQSPRPHSPVQPPASSSTATSNTALPAASTTMSPAPVIESSPSVGSIELEDALLEQRRGAFEESYMAPVPYVHGAPLHNVLEEEEEEEL